MKLKYLGFQSQWLAFLFVVTGIIASGPAHGQTSNGVLREVYLGIGGNAITDLTSAPSYPNSPSFESIEPIFEAPANVAETYGQRMRALILPPQTGTYFFWISSDDNGALYLSTDENPATRVQIATVNSWTSSREWTKEPNQKSAGINLTAGQRYYIEALQKEGGGGDNLAVRWQLPNATIEEPIPNNRLLVYGLGPPQITQQPVNITLTEGGSGTFSVFLSHMTGAAFQWFRNGTNVPGATNNSITVGPVTLADTTNRFLCFIANAYGTTNSSEGVLTVVPDTTPPAVSTVGNVGDLQSVFIVFSEAVDPATATNMANYSINNGITVLRAAFGPDPRTIILTTTPIPFNITNTLVINNVRDRASTPNTIAANTERTFSISSRPIDIGYLSLPREQLGPTSRRHGVVISEVMYHPTNRLDAKNLEFIEIYNTQPWYEELGGWHISGAIDFVFPSNTVLQGNSFLVVAANPTDFRSIYSFANVYGPFLGSNSLQNSSGALRLRNNRDAVLFEMNYTGNPPYPVAADGTGHSLVLGRPSYGEGDPRAWVASEQLGGNPGTNDVPLASAYSTVVINEFLAHTDLPQVDYIELYNYGNTAVNIGGCAISDDPATNKYVIPLNTILQPRGFALFTENTLGYRLSAGGETILFRQPNGKVVDIVKFGSQENGVATGRYPDGAALFTRLSQTTPGTNNAPFRVADVVINEVMYDPVSGDSQDEYVELYNRATNAVNIGGWRIRDAVSYNIPSGTIIGPNGYLVIAANAARLRSNYANLTFGNTLGNFSGSLANGGERIELNMPDEVAATNSFGQLVTNKIHIMVDEVTYGPGGRWGKYAGGGGSSLELIDTHSDHRLAPNWADSDETAKSQWFNVETTGVMDNGYADANQLHITLMGAGECLIDNVEVIPAGSTNLIGNSTFESGTAGWVFQGNHNDTTLETAEGYQSTRSLHLRATGRGDTGANRLRVQLPFTLAGGTTVTLRAKVRWLKGNPNILLRLRGNWLEAPGNALTVKNLGTPGQANSRAAANVGPAITGVRHDPPLPAASQPVLVVAQVDDPDGISLLTLNYRVDPSTNYSSLAMTNNGAGLYSTLLPGQAAGVTLAFYIAAMDNYTLPAGSSFPNDAPARECVVRWGDTAIPGTLPTYRFWVTQTNVTRWSTEEKMSNKPKDVTFIYGNSRIVYNAGAWFHGSPYHSPGYDSPVGAGCDYDMVFPKDEMLLGETDINLFRPGNGGGDGTSQAEIQAYWFGGQFGLPFLYCRPVFVYVNGQRRETAYYDAQQPNGDFVRQWYPDDPNGELHKIQIGFEFGDTAYGNGEAGFGGVGADLNRYTTTGGAFKQARYRQTWPLRSVSPFEQNDYTNLFALVNSVLTTASIGSDAYTAALTNITEVEEWFKVHVVQHMINNGDSFSYGGGQNAFAYKPERSPWKLLLWDVDFAFGGDPNDGNIFSIGGAEHGPRNDHPAFRRIYFQTLIEAANGFMTAARSNPILEARYNGMVAAGAGVGSPSGIEGFIATRRNVVLTQIAANQSTFRITSNGGADFSTNRNLITITGTAPLEVKTILVNGIAYPLSWTSLSNWVVRLPLSSGNNVLLITGLDPKGNPVPSVNGTIRVTYTGANELPQDKIVINEIMYNPYFADASFIEIYNTSVSNAFDMSGWMLRGADYTFSPGVIIEPGMYLLLAKNKASFIAAYGSSALVLDEFPGTLDGDGGTLTLVKPGATAAQDIIIDQVTYEKNLPWPADANGTGSSLQLIDVAQDNNRVSNWGAVPTNAAAPPVEWKYVAVTGTASSSLLYVYLQSAGDVYIDDIKMVSGSTPEVGVNFVQNGDFETAFPGPWTVSANHAGSVTSTSIKHSGNASLHVVASTGGTTQASAIWQTLSPTLVNGQTYTLSFWYLQSTNGGPLTLRLSGSGVQANLNIAPPGVANSVRVTPGFANSIRATVAPYPTLWLNEVLPNNFFLGTNGITDRFGDRDPWVELYNGGTNALSLDGYYLANNYTNVAQWAFPTGMTIPAKQFLTVWLDGEPSESTNTELHTSFRIASDVGSVVISRGTNLASIIDYLNYNIPTPGRSYGSYPDGSVSGRRLFGAVTPNGTNNPAFPAATVRINEWMADNTSTLADPADGRFDDWIELYNYGTNAVDLTGYYLSDTLTNATDSLVPAGTTIPAGGFLLVWADNTPAQNSPTNQDIHVKFSLSKTGEAIALFGPDGQLVDAVTFGPQTNDVTQGRFPDGATPIYFTTTPTPRGPNIVPEQNFAPVVSAIGDKNINEGSLLSFTVVASDPNGASQTLTYSIDGFPPSGSSINPNTGLFRWSPSEAQGPGVFTLTFRVTDNGIPPLSTTQAISITVNEVNNAPVIGSINSFTINEGTTMTFTNRATDSDTPKQTLNWSIGAGAPAGATINPTNGVFTWTPTEAQGPGTYSITVKATDDGSPPQTGSRSFSVTVNEVNTPPSIAFQTDWTVQAQTPISFKVTATDADLPAQGLVFNIDAGAPAGAAIDPATGAFTWTPTAANTGTNLLTLRVTDNGSPAGSDSKVLRVVVQSPLTASITVIGEAVSISCNSISGRTYRVEYKGDLSTGSWTPLSTNTANSSVLNFQDSKGTNSQRFYRIMQVD